MISIRRFNSAAEQATALAKLLREQLAGSPPYAVMLAGGRTPLEAYRLLAANPPAGTGAHLMLSDERMVPRDTPESNFASLTPLFSALGLPPEHQLFVYTELSPEQAAARYHEDLEAFFVRGGRIPLGLLGLGTDGHTASLFTAEHLQRAEGRLAVAVHRPDGLEGVSVTPSLLQRVEQLVFVVAGAEKQARVHDLLAAPEKIMAGKAVAGHPAVDCWVDSAADPSDPSDQTDHL